MEELIMGSSMKGNLNESAASGNGNTSDTGGNIFGFSQDTKDSLKSAGENMMAAGSAIGGVAGVYAASSAAALAAATGGTGVLAVGAVAGVTAVLGAATWFLGKYGEWHPDLIGDSGLAGVDPVTGQISPTAAVKALPNEIYGGVISGGPSGVVMTRQELHLAEIAIAAGAGEHVTTPNPLDMGGSISIGGANLNSLEFHLSGGGLVNPIDPSLLSAGINSSIIGALASMV
jgi:hypothetical protein